MEYKDLTDKEKKVFDEIENLMVLERKLNKLEIKRILVLMLLKNGGLL